MVAAIKDNEGLCYLPYRRARGDIYPADLLLFRAPPWIELPSPDWRTWSVVHPMAAMSHAIAVAGGGAHSHCGLADWIGGQLNCSEVKEGYGGRPAALSGLVRKYPGRIDVYRTNGSRFPEYRPYAALKMMRSLWGCPYGWAAIRRAALCHMMGFRWFYEVETKDFPKLLLRPFCSYAVSWAVRVGGLVDAIRNVADHMTLPSHLAQTHLWDYFCTLV